MNEDARHTLPATEPRSEDRQRRYLPEGWQAIGRCRQGLTGPTGCLVLAHPRMGIALIDVAPVITPSAEGRVRRLLAVGAQGDALPSPLPIGHLRVEPAEWPLLPRLLEATFAALPPLPADAGGARWIGAVRDALAADPAWMAATAAPREGDDDALLQAPAPSQAVPRQEAAMGRIRAGGGARRGLSWLACAVVFAMGLAAGRLLGSGHPAEAPAHATGMAVATPAGQASPFQAALALPEPDLPPPAAQPESPAAEPGGRVAEATAHAEVPPLASAVAEPPAPQRRASAAPRPPPPLTLDRRCADAMFRWHQGERVGWSEMAYLRQGCVGRTR